MHKWWIVCAIVAVLSALLALFFNGNDALREMATGSFGGCIIGALLLWYEEYREDRREQALELRETKNQASLDARGAANFLLTELKPIFDSLVQHLPHGKGSTRMCPEYSELRFSFQPLVMTGNHLINRVNDEKLNSLWNQFSEPSSSLFQRSDHQKFHGGFKIDSFRENVKPLEDLLDKTIARAEKLLGENKESRCKPGG